MIHIIIHPAWGYAYSTLDRETIFEKYKEKYQEYCKNHIQDGDSVLLFNPFLDKNTKMDIINTELTKIVNNIKLTNSQLNEKMFDLIIGDIYSRNDNKFNKPLKYLQHLCKKSDSKRKIYDKIYEYSNFVPLFYTCLVHSKEVVEIVDIFSKELANKNINLQSFNSGHLPLVHEKIDYIFSNLDGNHNVQLIGDWYNECIYSITYQINQIASNKNNLEVNTNVVKEFCSFNNTEAGLKKHLIHSKNNECFLSVSN